MINCSIINFIANKSLLLLFLHFSLFILFCLIKLIKNLAKLSFFPSSNRLIDLLLLTPSVSPCNRPYTGDKQANDQAHDPEEHHEHLKRGHVPNAVDLR